MSFTQLSLLDFPFQTLVLYNNNNQLYLKEGNDMTVKTDNLAALNILHVRTTANIVNKEQFIILPRGKKWSVISTLQYCK